MAWPFTDLRSRMALTVDSMKVSRRPVCFRLADLEDEVLQQLCAHLRVVHFGMKLHGVDAARRVRNAGEGVGGLGSQVKTGRKFLRVIAMRHPDFHHRRQVREERQVCIEDGDLREAILALVRRADLAAELMRNPLQAITDTEDRQAAHRVCADRRAAHPRHRPSWDRRRG